MEIKNNKILISTIIVALVVLVSFNFEKMTGQATAADSRIITAPSTVNGGDTIEITVRPRTGTMNLGGSYKEALWLKGPSATKQISNYECTEGYTGICKEAQASTWISTTWEPGNYYLSVEKTTPTTREILAKKTIYLR